MFEEKRKQKIKTGLTIWVSIGIFLVLLGFAFINNAYAIDAINATAIDEVQTLLNPEIQTTNVFHVFWIIFLLIILMVFMITMFKMREDRETLFFAIGALIVSILITLLFTSPLDFDIQQTENTIIINANNGTVTSAIITNSVKQMIIIPADQEFRLALSLLFTGITLFNGLYAIYIVTNYHEGNKLNPNRGKE